MATDCPIESAPAPAPTALHCEVYRSSRREGMYLYVPRANGLKDVPEALLARFGTAQLALTMMLTAERRLARANAREVLQALQMQGWYLQLPPAAVAGTDAVDTARAEAGAGAGIKGEGAC